MVKKKRVDEIAEQAAFFASLADPTRLRLFKLLIRQKPAGSLCVNALSALLGVTQSAVSQHLKVLRSVGLVQGERRGYHIHYRVKPESLRRCQRLLKETLSRNSDSVLYQQNCPVKKTRG
ncbi:MAG: metalloregulator ArsR/SmtB family transcription factor [Chloroflexota bacterium]